MNIRRMTTTATVALALGLGLSGTANAQSRDFKIPATLSYAQTNKQMWNTILLISAAVMIVGIVSEESTLTILGGAGVLISLIQTNNNGFTMGYTPRGINLLNEGPVSFGVSPFGSLGYKSAGITGFRPSPYIMANFKF